MTERDLIAILEGQGLQLSGRTESTGDAPARLALRFTSGAGRTTPSSPPGGHWLMSASPEAIASAYPAQSG